MIKSGATAKYISLGLAVTAHVGVAAALWQAEPVEIEPPSGALETALGNSFADMATGLLAADGAEDIREFIEATEVAEPPRPVETLTAPAPTIVTPVKAAAKAMKPAPTTPNTKAVIAERNLATTSTIPIEAAHSSVVSVKSATTPPPTPQTRPIQPNPAVKPKDTASVVSAATPKSTAPIVSKRPDRRPRALEVVRTEPAIAKRKAMPKTPVKSAMAPKRGNSNANMRKGTSSGTQTAKAVRKGTGTSKTSIAGNATSSNYPGQVRSRLDRVKRPRGLGRGSAVVAFRIASNGGLGDVSIAKSSGSAKLDRAALRVVQRAAPFPPPPNGARRSFSITIRGK